MRCGEGPHQRRLADAGLAGDQDQASTTAVAYGCEVVVDGGGLLRPLEQLVPRDGRILGDRRG
jgi:hypothetical protein